MGRSPLEPLDRWHKQYPKPGDEPCRCGPRTRPMFPTAEHGRGHRWLAVYTDPAGKIRKPSFADVEYDKAVSFLAEVTTDMRRGTWVDPAKGRDKVRDLADEWFAYLDRVYERESTTKTYKTHMRSHILPFLGRFPARELRRPLSNDLVERLVKADLAPSYVESVFKTWKVFVNWLATELEVPLPGNVVSKVKLPPVPPRVEVPLTPKEVTRLAEAIEPRYEIVVWMAACGGLRLGEIMGFTWARVVLDENKLRVMRQRQAGAEVSLKTGASFATLPVDPFLIRKLRQHRLCGYSTAAQVQHDTEVRRLRRAYVPPPDEDLVVVNDAGHPVRRQAFNKIWHKAVEEAGLPADTRLHDLKHFYSSNLGRFGYDRKTVQHLSRHGDPSMTDRYSHPPEAVEGLRIDGFGKLFLSRQERVVVLGDRRA